MALRESDTILTLVLPSFPTPPISKENSIYPVKTDANNCPISKANSICPVKIDANNCKY
jgi:hypothetical protein